jgi:glycosyltransferase involved in cell wall biosynthesis
MGIPVLWHIRESLRRSTLNDWYLRLVAMLACRVVAVSRSVLQDVLARTGIRQDKVNVIYNGIDLDWFDLVSSHDKTRAELGLVEGKKLVSLPAFLLPHKGHQILLEAMSILVHKMGIKQVCAVIIGEEAPDSQDRFTSELQAYCRANSLEEYVCFLGFRSDTPALLAHSDIICLPATYDDPLPNVVLEGMAVGKPVVASSAGGIPELIDDQRTGLLVPRGKPKELALALAELITDESRAVRLGQAGRHRAEREFSSRIHAERVQTVYKELLAK